MHKVTFFMTQLPARARVTAHHANHGDIEATGTRDVFFLSQLLQQAAASASSCSKRGPAMRDNKVCGIQLELFLLIIRAHRHHVPSRVVRGLAKRQPPTLP